MSKFSKIVLLTATAAAAGAGVYYLLQKKNEAKGLVIDGEILDAEGGGDGRNYVSLNLDSVESALQKAKEKISDSYVHVRDSVKAGFAATPMRDFTDLSREDDAGDGCPEGCPEGCCQPPTETEGTTKTEEFFS